MVNVNLPSIEDVWDMVFLSICSRLATHPSFLLIFTERRIWERLGCSRWKFFSVLHTFSIDRCFGDLYCLTRVSKSLKAINHSTCFRKFVQLFRTCSLKLTTRPWKMVFEKRSLFFGFPSIFRIELLEVGILPTSLVAFWAEIYMDVWLLQRFGKKD